MKTYTTGTRFERVATDIAVNFAKTERGNSYILAIQDYFTKYLVLVPMADMKAETVSRAIADHWIRWFGAPMEIYSDQGRQYESKLMKEVFGLFGIRKTRTTPLHPRSDGMVERSNRTTKEMLSKVVKDDQKDWDLRLPYLNMAYNNTPHETTKYSPHHMVYGGNMVLLVEAAMGISPNGKGETAPKKNYEYVQWLKKALENTHGIAREFTKRSVEVQRRLYDRTVKPVDYKVGDLVRLHQHVVKTGKKPSLDRFWTGPWVILRKFSEVIYLIRCSEKLPTKVVHGDSMKMYKGERTLDWYKPETQEFNLQLKNKVTEIAEEIPQLLVQVARENTERREEQTLVLHKK